MEATESRLTLKVGVLLPNCPEYAVVVLGVSLVYQFFFTTAKVMVMAKVMVVMFSKTRCSTPV